jgi:hypothetical protein
MYTCAVCASVCPHVYICLLVTRAVFKKKTTSALPVALLQPELGVWCCCANIRSWLFLDKNRLTGTIPDEFSALEGLQYALIAAGVTNSLGCAH